jgi:peptidylprolyl isomerase
LTKVASIAAALLLLVGCGGGTEPGGGCDTSVVEHDSGLKTQDLECGTGPEAETGDTVSVHYTGTLEDGTVFGSSEGGQPFGLRLGSGMVIQGWEEGLVGMREGGRRELTIPPELAYGAEGREGIPPNSTWIFEVELVELQKAES